MTYSKLAWLWLVLGLAGCGADDERGKPTCLPDCEGTRAYDATAYELRARFDWTEQRLEASEDVSLIVSSGDPVVELDAAVEIARVFAGAQALPFAVDVDAGTLRVDLTGLAPGSEPVTFTIEYQASVSDALVATTPRDADPVTARVVYTNSEPDRGLAWLVGKHDPSDRARWAVELTVDADDDVIANGRRVLDERAGGERVVRYEIDQPQPTYLMAFAAGQLEHTERTDGRVPLSLWYRRGLAIDPSRNLAVVADAMAHFESLLGPYPFDRYAVVLIPDFPGGMENTTITFNVEASGLGAVDVGLNAHELAHQWFGDWVTMRTYDDVWVKEGMATLLGSEAGRAARDADASGHLFGDDFGFFPDDAIVDPELTGLDKYTSGAYMRAAWLMTQIRSEVGEDAFWSTVRDVLADHALDSIDGETFVRSFASVLDAATITRIIGALERREVPSLEVAAASVATGTAVTFTLSDPTTALLTPLELTVIDADGQATTSQLDASAPLTLTIPTGGYLAPDEQDVHPDFLFWAATDEVLGTVTELLIPTDPDALAVFGARSASHQERALIFAAMPALTPLQLVALYEQLDSVLAREAAAIGACGLLGTAPDATAWLAALAPIVRAPAIEQANSQYAQCGTALPVQALLPELIELVDQPAAHGGSRLPYLLSFDFGPAVSLEVIAPLATASPSLNLRDLAIGRLREQAEGAYSAIPADQTASWRSFFRDLLTTTTSIDRFWTVWGGAVALGDTAALPAAGRSLGTLGFDPFEQLFVVCEAFALADGDPALWATFTEAIGSTEALAAETLELLDEPAGCEAEPR